MIFFTHPFCDIVAFLFDIWLAIWYAKPLEGVESSREKKLLGLLCLLSTAILYVLPSPLNWLLGYDPISDSILRQAGRALYRIAALYGYLRLSGKAERDCALYLAMLFNIMFLSVQNIRGILFTLGILPSESFPVVTYPILLLELAGVYLLHRMIDFRKVSRVGLVTHFLMILALFLEIYFKKSFQLMEGTAARSDAIEHLLFSLCAVLGVFLWSFLYEQLRQKTEENARLSVEQLRLQYEAQSARRTLAANQDMRHLYHDMKNHLLAIEAMAGDRQDLTAYLQELLPQFAGYETQALTGNAVVDALLSEKIQRALLKKISFSVCADLAPLNFVKTVDLITIFGNAVDNSIEAAERLEDERLRCVNIKTTRYANTVVVRFENPFVGPLREDKGQLLTGKEDAAAHGIGLDNIKRVVTQYNGSVATKVDRTGDGAQWFVLTLIIPLAQ